MQVTQLALLHDTWRQAPHAMRGVRRVNVSAPCYVLTRSFGVPRRRCSVLLQEAAVKEEAPAPAERNPAAMKFTGNLVSSQPTHLATRQSGHSLGNDWLEAQFCYMPGLSTLRSPTS